MKCPLCGTRAILPERLPLHQSRGACKLTVFKRQMEALDYAPALTADAQKLADAVERDLAWAHMPLRRGPVAVSDEDINATVEGVWWPAWCDYLAAARPLVHGREVFGVQVERVRTLVSNPAALRAYKDRVRLWRARGVDPEERFHLWKDFALLQP